MTTKTCRRCGEPIPSGLGGNCPRCLALLAVSTKGGDWASSLQAAKPLTAETEISRFFGDYEILGELGRGGMGIVYKARQVSLNRLVALKTIGSAQLGRTEIVRFRIEAEAAARLEHPNIVSIYEIGEHQGEHFYSMQLIEGGTVAALSLPAASQSADRQQRLIAGCLAKVARAIHHAHQRGVLHRDLKPGNVLIDAAGEPHVTDFGLAKLFHEDSGLTATTTTLGTPAFMAPEAASGKARQASIGTDVYSLGAVLYALLCGKPPFLGATALETMQLAMESEAESLRAINEAVDRDLEIICFKCLEKEPARRYSSALAFAEDLERWLEGEPILARPATSGEKFRRWCRRQPRLATSLLGTAVLLIVITFVSLAAAHRVNTARKSEQREHQSAVLANQNLARANQQLGDTLQRAELQLAEDRFKADDVSAALATLAAIVRRDPSNHIAVQRLTSALLHRDYPIPTIDPITGLGWIWTVELSADGQTLLVLWEDAAAKPKRSFVRVWGAVSGNPVSPIIEEPDLIVRAQFSPDGKKVVTASAGGSIAFRDRGTGQLVQPPLQTKSIPNALRFTRDGLRVMVATADGRVRIWNVTNAMEVKEWRAHNSACADARFNADGKMVVTASDRGSVRIWNAATGDEMFGSRSHTNISLNLPVLSVQFSPDDSRLLTVSSDNAARLWEVNTGALIGEPMRHRGKIWPARFSPDGEQIVTASADHTAQIWSGRTARPMGTRLHHNGALSDAQFSPNGRSLLTASWDNTAQLWDASTGARLCAPLRHKERVWTVGFSRDGESVVTGGADGVAQIWDVRPTAAREFRIDHKREVSFAGYDRSGRLFATVKDDGTVRVWKAGARQLVTRPLPHPGKVVRIEFSDDSRYLATASEDGKARIWELSSGKLTATLQHNGSVQCVRFAPDGKRIVTASIDRTARVWDPESGEPLGSALKHEGWVTEACFSPDGSRVATAADDHCARIWDVRTGELCVPTLLHDDNVLDVRFNPDGSILATASTDKTARLWSVRTGLQVGNSMRHVGLVSSVEFSMDGRRIVTASWDGTARVWDAQTRAPLSQAMQHEDQLKTARFSPDGRRVVTASLDGTARVWDATTGRALSEPLRHGAKVNSAEFSRDGEQVLTASGDGTVRIWDLPTPTLPAPPWLPEFAEAIGGLKLDKRENLEFASRSAMIELRNSSTSSPVDFYQRFRKWFFTDRSNRGESPLSE